MIEYIYIDNYKCFSNFTYEPGAIELILGDMEREKAPS